MNDLSELQNKILNYMKKEAKKSIDETVNLGRMYKHFEPLLKEEFSRGFFVYGNAVIDLEKLGIIKINNETGKAKFNEKLTSSERKIIHYLGGKFGPGETNKIMSSCGYKNKKRFEKRMRSLQEKGIVEISTDNDKTYYNLKQTG